MNEDMKSLLQNLAKPIVMLNPLNNEVVLSNNEFKKLMSVDDGEHGYDVTDRIE
jgi:hypothetical protein